MDKVVENATVIVLTALRLFDVIKMIIILM